MSDEQDKLKVSLEPPRLFGRKKKPAETQASSAPAEAPEEDAAPVAEAPVAEKAAPTEEPVAPAVEETAAAPVDEPDPAPAPAVTDAAEPTLVFDEVEDDAADEAAAPADEAVETTEVIEVVEVDEPVEEVEAETEPAPTETEPAPTEVIEAVEVAEVTEVVEPAEVDEPAKAAEPAAVVAPAAPAPVVPKAKQPKQPKPESNRRAPAASGLAQTAGGAARPYEVMIEREPVTGAELEDAEIMATDDGPLLERFPAAALTGGIVGVAAVGMIFLFLRGCESLRGTASCGGGTGFILLVATFALCIMLGQALLKAFLVREPLTTSFLACGVVAAVSLTFLIDLIDHWSMAIIVPVLAVGAFLGSVRLTDYIDESANIT